jgi:cyclic beta-1,2-glucan synthetase
VTSVPGRNVPDTLALAASALGAHHGVCPGRPHAAPVWAELDALPGWLDSARRCCADPPPDATKAAEWLLDNDYHVRRAIRQVREDMPPAFYRRLPCLSAPECNRMPRIFLLAHGMLDAAHMQLSLDAAVQFVDAYQEGAPLTIAELWAFPTMLRLACLEILVTAFSELEPGLDAPFEPAPGSDYRETHDPTEAVSRALSTLMAVGNIPWKDFFDQVSRVEAILRGDPAGVYSAMDFDTRDRYRKAVEEIALGAAQPEWGVATKALELARAHTGSPRRGHVGCWLVDEERAEIEASLGFRAAPVAALRRWALAHAGACYVGALIGFGAAALALPGALLATLDTGGFAWAAGLILSLAPASIISVALTHLIVTLAVPPRVLPKLDFEHGLAEGCAAAVVVPVILRAPNEVPALIERLEAHWLTNPDPLLHVALLSDLADADAEHMPADAPIEAALIAGVRRLNERYPDHAPFALLHRKRRWNEAEGCWMGWERKRGKLEQFNEFVLGEATAVFAVREGNTAALRRIRFVVTLDADTVASPGSLNRLLGALAHPLNRVEFDGTTGRARRGYTFIQPRVEISPEAGDRSLFTRLYTGDTSIDIYSRAISDVYQDLFGEGNFIGKGAYDVAAFRRCLHGRVPENALVSHDLFEGLHARAALATDAVFYEGFPSQYLEYTRRWHRWVRGDWQLVPWLAGKVPGRDGTWLINPLSALDRWKIFDNLRRSLLPAALVALAAIGWLALPGDSWIWSALTVAAPGAYLFTDLVTSLARGRRRGAVQGRLRRLADHAGRWLLAIVFLAHKAVVSVDAVARACWRVFVSGRRMLEWTSAAHTAALMDGGRAQAWAEMVGAPVLATLIALALAATSPAALPGAAPLLLLWFTSPEIAFFIGRERRRAGETLDTGDRMFLRRLARRTWLYFETFAGPGDNWLPPDNYQTEPHEETAHRTSPTNIGMLFLSSLAAWDLGHVGLRDLAVRTRYTLNSLDRLERYRGHVLNWFDTRTLQPLKPRYVSTVDSGNLAVSLLTLREGCMEATRGPALSPVLWAGLEDAIGLLREAVLALPQPHRDAIARHLDAMLGRIPSLGTAPSLWHSGLTDLRARDWPELETLVAGALDPPTETDPRETHVWLERVGHHVASIQRDLDALAPWCALTKTPPPGLAPLARRIDGLLGLELPLDAVEEAGTAARAALAEASSEDAAAQRWLANLNDAIERGTTAQADLRQSLVESADRAGHMAFGMDFGLLYDSGTRTFFIGYNISSDSMDPHHYDLLATEARLASYFAIAKRDVSAEHWFHLGRPITRAGGDLTAMSWNGSMFEYLMPSLLLPSEAGRLLGQSERAAVAVQRRYGEKLDLPWGVSESAYAARDAEHRYQYQAFGVPGLGLKRGLSEDYVVAPYASALALAVAPVTAVRNLRRLDEMGLRGLYGCFESADFTPGRRPARGGFTPVQAFMAHHQGMILAAIDNALNGDVLIRRFGRDPRMRSIELLLQERVPWEFPQEEASETETTVPDLAGKAAPPLHGWDCPTAPSPQIHVIGNGRMASWITGAGGGALWWHDQSLTRWTGDAVCDDGNARIYLRDAETGSVWSLGHRPSGAPDQNARVVFHAHKAEFHQRDHGLSASLEIAVAQGDDVEIRRVMLVNENSSPREIDLTSYAEVVLAPAAMHERHPAFSKLFVHSERLASIDGLLFTRRPRRPGDRPPVLFHSVLCEGPGVAPAGFETDRRAFLGRHGDSARPPGATGTLSGATGWTLDPVMALRARVSLAPRARAQVAFITIAAGSRESAIEIAERYATAPGLDWAVEDAARSAALEAHRLGLTPAALADAQAICRDLLYPRPAANDPGGDLSGQPRLWGLGLSGDLPIFLIRVTDAKQARLLPAAIRAHQWWRRHGLRTDLVILRAGTSGYEEPMRDRLVSAMREAGVAEGLGGTGGIHMHAIDRIGGLERRMLETAARVVLDGAARTLADARAAPAPERSTPPRFEPVGTPAPEPAHTAALMRPADLSFDNGYGGFTPDGKDYVIHLEPGLRTPAPWCNVLANETFGTIVSEAGLGFTWDLNSGERRLTPWSNDPVIDPQAEALYLRDEETAKVWTPTPQPAGGNATCQIRHRAGTTTWLHNSEGLEQCLTVFVPSAAPVKLAILRVSNPGGSNRRLTATYYAEWLLGALAGVARPHVVCGYHVASHALIARNGWNPEFGERVAFLASSRPPHSLTCDRAVFLGRDRARALPAGLTRSDLGGKVAGVADPCAAFQVHLDLAPGGIEEVAFVLGEGRNLAEMERLVDEWSNLEHAHAALAETRKLWDRRLGAVQVATPDAAFDLMINRWLLHQTLGSRVLARAGFHQAGGAFGFRDQLQDMMALMFTEPARVRAHILECAGRQFEEGDVLHWWHPPEGRGVRTRCSDDLLWLPYATSRYVAATGDASILDEEVPFLSAPPLADDEEDRYAMFEHGVERMPLFEHCLRAMKHGVTFGAHGLPLIGAGDWNDGMDHIGSNGRGESVWLGWFAAVCSDGFANLAALIGRDDLDGIWRSCAEELRRATDRAGWDGAWYVRAFDDDGLAWGSKDSDECQIDSIAQSWAALADGPSAARTAEAVASATARLVDRETRLVRLLAPPFDRTPRDPGYIRAYPPGVRENGGQYTHAAAWLGLAHARLGDGDWANGVFDLINPIRRAASRADAARYRAEPYVVPADVRGTAPGAGQAGWTWYTGAAGWTWRLGVEGILGLRLDGGAVTFSPCLPRDWGIVDARIKGPDGVLVIHIEDPERLGSGRVELTVDGRPANGDRVTFPSGGTERRVNVRLLPAAAMDAAGPVTRR